MSKHITRVLIWSGWFRLSHLFIGGSVLVLLATGSLISHSPFYAALVLDLHHYASGFLTTGLLIRFALMIKGQPQERFGNLIPKPSELRSIREMLRFYLLFGKAPLPKWYAQNPFWKPIYLAFYMILSLQVISGLMIADDAHLMGFYMPSVHLFWSNILLALSLAHIINVIWLEYEGRNNDISAIIHGEKTFISEAPRHSNKAESPLTFTPMKTSTSNDKSK